MNTMAGTQHNAFSLAHGKGKAAAVSCIHIPISAVPVLHRHNRADSAGAFPQGES